jgi:hypothetical protein
MCVCVCPHRTSHAPFCLDLIGYSVCKPAHVLGHAPRYFVNINRNIHSHKMCAHCEIMGCYNQKNRVCVRVRTE